MKSAMPETVVLHGGETACRFKNGELLNAGKFTAGKNVLMFDLCPDAENPACAEIFHCGKVTLKMENFQLRIVIGENTFLHHAKLLDNNFNPVEIAGDGTLLKITVDHDRSIVVSGAEMMDGEVIFTASEAKYRFRGMIKNLTVSPFTAAIEIPEKQLPPAQLISMTDEFPQETDLGGEWEFFCTPISFDPANPLPPETLFTGKMVIPGYWDDHYDLIRETRSFDRSAKTNPRFRPLSFPMGELTPDASMPYLTGTGYYRKSFRFAPGEKPASVTLRLGPAVWGSTVYCNGRLVSHLPGYSTWHSCSLDDFLNFDDVNTLVIAVSNFDHVFDGNTQENSQHIGLAVRGFQGMRCGISGGCFLQIAGTATPITDAYARFDGKTLHLFAESTAAGNDIRWSVADATGKTIRSATGREARVDAENLSRWDDENPYLYTVTATVVKEEKVLDSYTFNCGLRQIAVSGSQIMLNGIPVYLRGITEHHFFPETANAPCDLEKYIRDITIWKSYGFNFLRFHTWCPPEQYLEAADRCGMICQIEVPPHENADEWRRIMKYLRRHASALIICGGNEEDFTDFRIAEVRELAEIASEMIPEALFNPQEGLSKVEYRMLPDEPGVETEPFVHHPARFDALAGFSDCYGSYSWGYFSYMHTLFPGVAEIDKRYAIYGKPVLSHEIGILGGWLDFENEKKYAGCVVPGDFYAESRKYLTSINLFDRAEEFYRINCETVNRLRKALLENIRRCTLIAGFDLLGAYDAHWHRCGYPCGLLDEFNRPKYGVSPESICRSNDAVILLCDVDAHRAKKAGEKFSHTVMVSNYGKKVLPEGVLTWQFTVDGKEISGAAAVPETGTGQVQDIAKCEFTLPEVDKPQHAVLQVALDAADEKLCNSWDFWIFPAAEKPALPENCRIVRKLDDETIDFINNGGNVLLTANFPAARMVEKFQVVTAGRSAGHYGVIIHDHPLMANMAHQGFADWQFFTLLQDAVSLDFTGSELPFAPIMEYIPSYKRAHLKTPLCEYRIGKGRVLMCGLRFEKYDPAGNWLFREIIEYLAGANETTAVQIDAGVMKKLIRREFPDSGRAKTDEAWDPNVSAGKNRKNNI